MWLDLASIGDKLKVTEQLPWIALKDVAPMFGLRYQTCKNLVHLGRFPVDTYKLGRIRVVDRVVLDAYFAAMRDRGLQVLKEAPSVPSKAQLKKLAREAAQPEVK
jgi:hypothetical protein